MSRRQLPIALPAQLHFLRSAFPASTGGIRGNVLEWNSSVTPSPMSSDYRIDLRYEMRKPPKVWAREPDLKAMAKGKDLPHVYDQATQHLCLYHPDHAEWEPTLLLSRTVVPWAVLWFYYFEIWLVTGEWPGNGAHPIVTL
jgi:hypothetical protein